MTGVALHHKRKQPTGGDSDVAAASPASKQLETDDLYDVPVGIATDRGGKLNQEVRDAPDKYSHHIHVANPPPCCRTRTSSEARS